MTKEQTQIIVGLIARAYPKHYANMTAQEKWEVVALYYDFFKDTPFEMMKSVVKEYISQNRFPPSIADLGEKIRYIVSTAEEMTVESCIVESWKAITGNKKFEDLSEPSKVYWGSQLSIDAVGYSEDAEYTVVRGQMQKRLPDIIKMLKDKGSAGQIRESLAEVNELPIGFDESGRIVKALKG